MSVHVGNRLIIVLSVVGNFFRVLSVVGKMFLPFVASRLTPFTPSYTCGNKPFTIQILKFYTQILSLFL